MGSSSWRPSNCSNPGDCRIGMHARRESGFSPSSSRCCCSRRSIATPAIFPSEATASRPASRGTADRRASAARCGAARQSVSKAEACRLTDMWLVGLFRRCRNRIASSRAVARCGAARQSVSKAEACRLTDMWLVGLFRRCRNRIASSRARFGLWARFGSQAVRFISVIRRVASFRRTSYQQCCPFHATANSSLPDDFDEHAFATATVELAVENLLPRAEIEPPIGDRDHNLTPHDLAL